MNKLSAKLFNFFIDESVNKFISYANYAILFILFIGYQSGGISGSAVLLVTKTGLHIELGLALFIGTILLIGLLIEMLLSKLKNEYGETFYSLNNHAWILTFFIFSLLTFWYIFQLNCDHLEFVSENSGKIVYISSERNIEILHIIYKSLISYFGLNAIFSPYLFYKLCRK